MFDVFLTKITKAFLFFGKLCIITVQKIFQGAKYEKYLSQRH